LISSCGIVVQADEEEDCAWYVDEGVCPVDPYHQGRVLEEESLYTNFPKDVKLLLEVDELEGVPTSDMNSAFNERKCSNAATYLVYLIQALVR
jgi:hypothetical protein